MSEPVPDRPLKDIRPTVIEQMLTIGRGIEEASGGHQPDTAELVERTRRVVIYAQRAARHAPLFEPDIS